MTDEDLFLLEDILSLREGINKHSLLLLAELSVLSDKEVDRLKYFSRQKHPTSILGSTDISPGMRNVLEQLVKKEKLPLVGSEFRHLTTAREDLRYRWRGKTIFQTYTFGYLVERDPGEFKIADFASFYLSGQYKKLTWVLGDHQISSGFGLLAGSAFPPVKGFVSGTSLSRLGQGLRPHRSAHETWALRGVGLSGPLFNGVWQLSLARNRLDGTLDPEKGPKVNATGLHRGLNTKTDLLETAALFGWEYEVPRFQGGVLYAHQKWSNAAMSFKTYDYASVYALLRGERWKWIGEGTLGRDSGNGLMVGFIYRQNGLRYLIHFRRYGRNFHSFRSSPLAEWRSAELNETGIYQGLSFRTGSFRFNIFGDVFSQPEKKGGKQGYENGFRVEYTRQNNRFFFQWKISEKTTDPGVAFIPEHFSSTSIRKTVKCWYQGSNRDNLRWKVQWIQVIAGSTDRKTRGRGLDLRTYWQQSAYRIEFDWTFVWVESYDARLYFWDVNLPGEMRNRMFNQSGHSPAFILRYNSTPRSELGLRLRADWQHFRFDRHPNMDSAFFLTMKL